MSSPQYLIDPSDELHPVNGAAKRMGNCSPWSVRGWIKEGRLRATYAGSRVLIAESEIQRFLKESTEHALARPRRVRKSAAK